MFHSDCAILHLVRPILFGQARADVSIWFHEECRLTHSARDNNVRTRFAVCLSWERQSLRWRLERKYPPRGSLAVSKSRKSPAHAGLGKVSAFEPKSPVRGASAVRKPISRAFAVSKFRPAPQRDITRAESALARRTPLNLLESALTKTRLQPSQNQHLQKEAVGGARLLLRSGSRAVVLGKQGSAQRSLQHEAT
jgi:hypothetical protein